MFNSTSSNDEVIDDIFRTVAFVFITLPSSRSDQTVSKGYKLAHESSATEYLCFIIQFTLFKIHKYH